MRGELYIVGVILLVLVVARVAYTIGFRLGRQHTLDAAQSAVEDALQGRKRRAKVIPFPRRDLEDDAS